MATVPWPGEIVVCDNNSKDRTAEVARVGGARVVFEPHNQIARARNTGARAALGEWLVFVDADTRIPPEALREALDLLESGTVAGGGSVFRMDCGGNRSGALVVRTWTWISRRFHIAAGSFLFARSDAFAEVRGFPLGVYAGEELWLSRSLKRWGRRRGMGFRVLHRHPVSTSGRKLEWFPPWFLAGTFLLMTICPFLSRSRAFCRIWYRRPAP
jgi:glycosyltransferase involved in cell wall biosynthesis